MITNNPRDCERLAVKVSRYESHRDTQAQGVAVADFLLAIDQDKERQFIFEVYRQNLAKMITMGATAEQIKYYKKPFKLGSKCITPGGYYPTARKADAPGFEPSGLLCMDIDRKDNPGISSEDWATLPAAVMESQLGEFVCYIGESTSGYIYGGYYLLLAIPRTIDTARYKRLYLAVARWFERNGINVDKQAANQNHCRCCSAQTPGIGLPLVNTNPREWITEYKPQPKQPRTRFYDSRTTYQGELKRAAECVQDIVRAGRDITGNYSEWFDLALAFAREFGNDGEPLFIALSSCYDGFNEAESLAKYKSALAAKSTAKRRNITIRTFWGRAKAAGFNPRDYKAGKP